VFGLIIEKLKGVQYKMGELPKKMIKPVSQMMSETVALCDYYCKQEKKKWEWAISVVDKMIADIDALLKDSE